jgi:hypothetical protein
MLALTFMQDSDSDGEDFGDELDKVTEDEDEPANDVEAGKKRKVCTCMYVQRIISSSHSELPRKRLPAPRRRRSLCPRKARRWNQMMRQKTIEQGAKRCLSM